MPTLNNKNFFALNRWISWLIVGLLSFGALVFFKSQPVIHYSALKVEKTDISVKNPQIDLIVAKHTKNVSTKKFILPKNLKLLESTSATYEIGTSDQPTIDGGIINQSNPIPTRINSEWIQAPTSQHSRKTKINNRLNNHLTDDSLNNKSVRNFLERSIQDGKLEYILKKSDQMAIPAAISIVPMVESGYRNSAVSPKGAAGAWQLMPETAREFGVNSSARFDFKSSTDAALKLLNELHQRYGNWQLAFAAYNAGCGRIDKALKENPNYTSIDELAIPDETKMYVAKIMLLNKKLELTANNG